MAEPTRKKTKKNKEPIKAARIFTDREELRAAFWRQYEEKKTELASEDDYIHVLNYYGFGGIGKSALLKKLMEELDEKIAAPLYANYDFETATDLRTMLSSLKKQLATKYRFEFPLFDIGLYFYAQKCGEKVDPVEKGELISGSPLLALAFSVADNFPGISMVTKILSTIDEVAAFGRTKAYLKKHERVIRQLEYLEREEVYQKLPALFSEDLERNLEAVTQPLVIFLDTYELLVNEMDSVGEPLVADNWLRGDNGPIQNVPKLLWVIAGREKLKWTRFDDDWETAIDSHILGELSEQDSTWFLRNAGIEDELLCKQLYALTNGTPVYLDLCVACFERLQEREEPVNISKFGQDSVELIERFVRYMDDSQKDLAYMTACLGKWNDDLFAAIAPLTLPGWSYTTYEKLKDYSFVNLLDNGYYNIHQTVRKVLVEKCPAIIKTKTADAIVGHFSKVLKESESIAADYAVALTYMVQAGLLVHKHRNKLCEFYEAEVEGYFLALVDAGRFEETQTIFHILLPEVEMCQEDLLYAIVMRARINYFRDKGDYQTANVLAQRCCLIFSKLLGEDHPDTLGASGRLASTLTDLGNYGDAQKLLQETVDKQKRILGEDHPDTISSMNNLALIFSHSGRTEEALVLLLEVLQKETKKFGTDHPYTLIVQGNVATMFEALGRYDEALNYAQDGVEKHKRILGDDHPGTLISVNNLARTLYGLGRYKEALELEEDLLERRKRILGEDHPLTLVTMGNLATTLAGLGKYEDALALNKILLTVRKRVLGEEHPDTLRAMNNLAIAYQEAYKEEEALKLHQEVLIRCTERLGENHPDTLMTMSNISCVLIDMGRYEEATKFAQKAAEKLQLCFKEDTPSVLTALNNVSLALSRTGKFDEALKITEQVLVKRKRLLGEDHPDTLITMRNLVGILMDLEKKDRAYEVAEALLEKRKRVQGEDHPATLTAMHLLGSVLYAQEQYDAACALTEDLLERRRRVLGEDHSDTLITMENLLLTMLQTKESDEILSFAYAVLEKETQILGNDHPNAQYTREIIDKLKSK